MGVDLSVSGGKTPRRVPPRLHAAPPRRRRSRRQGALGCGHAVSAHAGTRRRGHLSEAPWAPLSHSLPEPGDSVSIWTVAKAYAGELSIWNEALDPGRRPAHGCPQRRHRLRGRAEQGRDQAPRRSSGGSRSRKNPTKPPDLRAGQARRYLGDDATKPAATWPPPRLHDVCARRIPAAAPRPSADDLCTELDPVEPRGRARRGPNWPAQLDE